MIDPPTLASRVIIQEKVSDAHCAILSSKAGCMISVSSLVGGLALFFP